MKPCKFANRGLLVSLMFVLVPLLVLAGAMAAPALTGSRTTTNCCSACHGGTYTMYLAITSYSVPGSFNEDTSNIYCNVSVTGNMNSKPSMYWSYYLSTVTITATSASGKVGFVDSPKTYSSVQPGFAGSAVISAYGKGNGSDTITLTGKIVPAHQSVSCTRTEAVSPTTQVKVNVPPSLSGGKVSPTQGNISQTFEFEVNYTDADGDTPAYLRCGVDGTWHDMSVKDGTVDTVTSKEAYSVSVPASAIGLGSGHKFNFTALDGKHKAGGDVAQHGGPDVLLEGPPSCRILDPLSGTYGGWLNVSGTAQDDPWDTVTSVELSFGHGPWLPANGTTTWYIMANMSLYPDGPMEILARARTDAVLSPNASVNITVDRSLLNTPPFLGFGLAKDSVVPARFWLNGTVTDPELPGQAVSVKVGIDNAPTLLANVSGTGTLPIWSVELDLSSLDEAPLTIYAKAWDNYTASAPASLRLLLNKPPVVTLDPLPANVWGPEDIAGTVIDKEANLTVNVSVDGGPWLPANVTGCLWSMTYNFSSLAEGVHLVRVLASDGREDGLVNSSVLVEGPWGAPVLVDVVPEKNTIAEMGQDVEFLVHYTPGDKRGTVVEWYLEGVLANGSEGNGTARYMHAFDGLGAYQVRLVVSNKADPALKLQLDWNVDVAASFGISPACPTEIKAVVGELVLLQFRVDSGSCTSVTWTQNGTELDGQYYVYFMPTEPGLAAFKVVAKDAYGNTATLHFNVTVQPEKEISTEPREDAGFSPLVSIVIGCLAICFILASIYTFVVVGKSLRGKKDGPSGGVSSTPPKPPAQPVQTRAVPKQPAPLQDGPGSTARSQYGQVQVAQPTQAPPQARTQFPGSLYLACVWMGGTTVLRMVRDAGERVLIERPSLSPRAVAGVVVRAGLGRLRGLA